ncbi:CHAP domain-containing protein [Nocardia mangyaensis]|uniref:CHAP domain-containing protein n=1 Tax=Nocardia mangyaensis TaxID=2213200 RepID=A0A1J0VXK9_9NOCA|nr:CHAP domain-containing protein [Nocardia mangyaensis]APE36745.1 CHAP domain-containing protein [Nocardia mangyaensis]
MTQVEVERTGRKGRWIAGISGALAVAALVVVGAVWWQHDWGEPFPVLDSEHLDEQQVALVEVLRREYENPGDGPKYAEGVREAWCADFVSWTMREAGRPLANPHSGSWRIPGVYTLTEYYQGVGRFTPGDVDYRPRTGDVVLYGPNSPLGQHTNIVLKTEGATITTIGGNEMGGIRVRTITPAETADLVGYGRF